LGKCSRGDDCKYSHDLSDEAPQQKQQQQQIQLQQKPLLQQSWQPQTTTFTSGFGTASAPEENEEMEIMDEGQEFGQQEPEPEVDQTQQLLLQQKQEQIRLLKEKQKQLEQKIALKKTISQVVPTEEEQTLVFDEDAEGEYVEDGEAGGEEEYYEDQGYEEEAPLEEEETSSSSSTSSASTVGSTTVRIAEPPSNISLEQLTNHFSAFGSIKEIKTKGDAIFVTFDSASSTCF
jgi:hypothetical protein